MCVESVSNVEPGEAKVGTKIRKLDIGKVEEIEIIRNRELILECAIEIEKLNNKKSQKKNELDKILANKQKYSIEELERLVDFKNLPSTF